MSFNLRFVRVVAMTHSRNKGAAFEREVANLIRESLGYDCKRNLMQAAEGGHDLIGIPGLAIECKRYKEAKRNDLVRFWKQTWEQAKAGDVPILIVKEDRKPIDVYIQWDGAGAADFEPGSFDRVVKISFDLWVAIMNSSVDTSEN